LLFLEPEAQERQRKPDAIGRGGELLVEQDEPERPEQIQRPGDRPRNEDYG
jgi:hypothetical protein